jgi:acetyltransferase
MLDTVGMQQFFEPRSVAIIGASTKPGKVGHDILRNMLTSGFGGEVHPINPHAKEILGRKCYSRVTEVEGDVDLAVIVVPSAAVLSVMQDCGEKGIGAAVVISAGFKEAGAEGLERERELGKLARKLGIRVVGPRSPPPSSTGRSSREWATASS